MILRKIRSLHRNQSGYSLIELLAVLAISGIISLGATMANSQVITQTTRNDYYTTATRHVLNAVNWISRDAQMAQSINGTSGFPATSNLTFSWVTWDNQPNQVVYDVTTNHTLIRSHTAGDDPAKETVIAQYINIDPASTYCSWNDLTGEVILTVTCSVGVNTHAINVKKEKTIVSRPNL